jgi:hypothetical protein
MARETYVLRDGQLVPKAEAYTISAKHGDAPAVMGDITPFRTIDGVEISSRSHLRAYEQANGVRQVGNDFNSHFGINKR